MGGGGRQGALIQIEVSANEGGQQACKCMYMWRCFEVLNQAWYVYEVHFLFPEAIV